MLSKITIEVDFDNNNAPIIQILQYPDSTDVRDRLIKNFLEKLNQSLWCTINHKESTDSHNIIHIKPIPMLELKAHAKEMVEQCEYHEKWIKEHNYPPPY